MEVVKRLKPTADDKLDIKQLMELCNMARNFFEDEGFKALGVIKAQQEMSDEHLKRAFSAVYQARCRVLRREPHDKFPVELKEQYKQNLLHVMERIQMWRALIA